MSINISFPHQASRAVEVLNNPTDLKSKIKEAVPLSAIRLAGRAREAYWRTRHPLTFGAAVALTDVKVTEIALVRQTYCNSSLWQLPGGGIDKRDRNVVRRMVKMGVYPERLPANYFLPSALRELSEELGVKKLIDVNSVSHVVNHTNYHSLHAIVSANKDTLGIFHIPLLDIESVEFSIQKSEIEEVRLWDLEEVLERSESAFGSKSNMAPYLGNVATKLLARNPESTPINFVSN